MVESKVTLTIEVSQKAYDYMMRCARSPSRLIDYLFSHWADQEQKEKEALEEGGGDADENKE